VTEVQFLPWMRSGLAASITTAGATGSTVTIQPAVDVLADAEVIPVTGPSIQLRGPGDVIGLDPAEIKRRDPEPGAVGAETNYFCSVEFFAPDLPWRYTPVAVDRDGHLPPWLVLVVVELADGVGLATGGRLPVLSVDDPDEHLPDLADSWAWAHVQAATSLTGGVAGAYETDPGAFTSRLLCPRRLDDGVTYTVCIVPAYAAGRDAGLGRAPLASLDPAWENGPVELPVYDSWELTAGDNFDFKTLAKRIAPTELPDDVGFRDLDLTEPGGGIRPIETPASFVGAMHAPVDEVVHWSSVADRRSFEHDIHQRLARPPAELSSGPDPGYDALTDDPVVAPSVYGAPQLGTSVVPDDGPAAGWFEELNIAPHHRSVAGLGAEVVRADQESLMAAAWEQARPALLVNRALNRSRLAEEVARQAQRKWDRVDDATAVSIASPALASIRVAGTTAKRLVVDGDAPSAYFGAGFRRLGRPNGPLSTRATAAAARSPALAIVAAALRTTSDDVAQPPSPLSTGFRARYLPAGMDAGIDLAGLRTARRDAPGTHPGSRTERGVAGRADRRAMRERTAALPVHRLVTTSPVVDHVDRTGDRLVGGVDRTGDRLVDGVDLAADVDVVVDLQPYTFALVRAIELGRVATTDPSRGELGVDLAAAVRRAVRPDVAIADSIRSRLVVPTGTWSAPSIPTSVGLQPRFTDPMYERVRALSVDYLVPGVGSVRNNTLGVLEVNPAYVEAFLVGLNHEMSRELRWREYPASLGQTWFQHFFESTDPDAPPDIAPIDAWIDDAPLGHEYGGDDAPSLVVLIKADLIRKYPDVRVYAVPATLDADGIRVPDADAETVGPTFVGTLQRGASFYGFEDLSEEEARGDGPGDEGWFFVLEEEPRAMRFGLDRGTSENKGAIPGTWSNLAWAHLAVPDGTVPWFCPLEPPNSDIDTTLDGLDWGQDAAVMAAITFRRPIQVFMHASAMLPEPGGPTE